MFIHLFQHEARQARFPLEGLCSCLSAALAVVALHCDPVSSPDSQECEWGSYFEDLGEPTATNPFVVGYPAAGSTIAVGDTFAIAFKRHTGFDYPCWGFQLRVDDGTKVAMAYTLDNDLAMADENGMGLPQTEHDTACGIDVIKMVLPSELVAWGVLANPDMDFAQSVSIVTDSAYLEVGLDIFDCCCPGEFQSVSIGPFSIVNPKFLANSHSLCRGTHGRMPPRQIVSSVRQYPL